jgi:hypothetical protein
VKFAAHGVEVDGLLRRPFPEGRGECVDNSPPDGGEFGIMGAGAIGCYVGGALAAGGADVVFVGREKAGDELRAHGLTVVDMAGSRRVLSSDRLVFRRGEPAALVHEVEAKGEGSPNLSPDVLWRALSRSPAETLGP